MGGLPRRTAVQWAAVLCLAACAPAPAPDPAPDDPAALFAGLEQRLLAAHTVRLDFRATSTGLAEIDVRGSLFFSDSGAVEVTASGDFGGQPVNLSLRTQGGTYLFGNGSASVTEPTPGHLREALVIGLTRMGILHNLARLTGNEPPDHADGGARDWVVLDDFAADSSNARAVSFSITVSGQPAGFATLAIDPNGAPALRHQTVQFSAGEMRVVEEYSHVVIDP